MQTTLWLVLLGLFMAGYLALEGADFGAAMLLPVFGRKNQSGRDATVRAIAPLFLGNEVWLVAAVGVTEGAFAKLDGVLISSLYPAFVVILLAWLTRDAGLWFRSHGNETWRWRWDCTTAIASAVLAGMWGITLANLALGNITTLTPQLQTTTIFGPTPILCGLLLAAFCALHGSTFLSQRLPNEQAATIRNVTRTLPLPVVATVVLTGTSVALSRPSSQHWPLWTLGAILLIATMSTRLSRRTTTSQTEPGRIWFTFSARRVALSLTSLALAASAPLVALAGFPYRLSTADPATLGALTPIVLAVAPILVACQVALWWLSRTGVNRSWSYF
jgi:cytochrome d ubiquinol oxidase subunit II